MENSIQLKSDDAKELLNDQDVRHGPGKSKGATYWESIDGRRWKVGIAEPMDNSDLPSAPVLGPSFRPVGEDVKRAFDSDAVDLAVKVHLLDAARSTNDLHRLVLLEQIADRLVRTSKPAETSESPDVQMERLRQKDDALAALSSMLTGK